VSDREDERRRPKCGSGTKNSTARGGIHKKNKVLSQAMKQFLAVLKG
jgi:hypothetical protein